MKLLNFLYQLKSEQVPLHVYIKSPTKNLYLGNNGKMEKTKVIFDVKKETKDGLVSQTLYDIENKKPLKFEYKKSANDKDSKIVPEDKKNVTFNYVDFKKEVAKIMIGEENCLFRNKDDFVYAHKCSHLPTNKDEIFIIKNVSSELKKKRKKSYHHGSDDYSHVSEVSGKKSKERKDIPHNSDKISGYSDSFSDEVSVSALEESTKTTESTIEDEKPIKRTKIKKLKKIPVKKNTHSINHPKNSSPIHQKITSSRAYSNDNNSTEFTEVIGQLQNTISDLIKKLNIQNNGRNEKNFNEERNLQNSVYTGNTRSASGLDSPFNDIYESVDQINSNNDYSKNVRGSGDYHILGTETKSSSNTHDYSLNPTSVDIKGHEHQFLDLEELYHKNLEKMRAKGNKILNDIRNIKPDNIEELSIELKNLLERIKNIRLEYIQNAQNKANEYLMSLSNLTTKILNLEKYLTHIKANLHNFFSTTRTQNQVPAVGFVI